jgi:hypothetical protein
VLGALNHFVVRPCVCALGKTKAVGRGKWEPEARAGAGAKSEIFKRFWGGSVFGSIFYITYSFLYFGAYMS